MAVYQVYGCENMRLSNEEAEKVLEDSRLKDFWAVDEGYYDNREKLQAAINALYNSEGGNMYRVTYQENQNGKRLIIYCQICSKDLSSYDPFISHENGKAHKKTLQQRMTPRDPNIRNNLQTRPHNTYKGIFPENSLEDMIDSTRHVVIGVQFVYKEVIDGGEKFTCQLCQKSGLVTQVKTSNMFSHLKTRDHMSKYMNIKFGFSKKLYADYDGESHYIEESEGKIHAPIVDFTKQLNAKPAERSANYEPIGKKVGSHSEKKDKHSNPEGRSQRRSESHSPVERQRRSRKSRSCSPSKNRRAKSNSLKERSASPVSIESSARLPVSKPVTENVPVNNIKDLRRKTGLLTSAEGGLHLLKDLEFQELLHSAFWALNQKLDRYFEDRDVQCYDADAKRFMKATIATRKLQEHLKAVKIVTDF